MKKAMNKLLASILSFCMILSLVPATALAVGGGENAGMRIVTESYQDGILKVNVQAKTGRDIGISLSQTLLSYDSAKLRLVHPLAPTDPELDYTPTEIATTPNPAPIVVALKTGDRFSQGPMEVSDIKLYGKDGRAGLYIAVFAKKGSTEKLNTWTTVFTTAFEVVGKPADASTVLNRDSLRLANKEKDDTVISGVYTSNASFCGRIQTMDNPSIEYYTNPMAKTVVEKDNRYPMTDKGNNTATYPGSTNKPPQIPTNITAAPTAGAITYGQTLADSALSGGEASVAGSFAWKDTTAAPTVADSKKTEYEVVFTPDSDEYAPSTCKVKVEVNPKRLTDVAVADIAPQTYTGEQLKPAVTVTGLVKDKDYTVNYGTNTNVGEAEGSVTIKPVVGGNYTFDDITKTFEIKAAAISDNVMKAITAVTGLAYTSKPQDAIAVGTAAEGYTLSYSSEENGTYVSDMPTVTNAGDYTFWVKVEKDNYTAQTKKIDVSVAKADYTGTKETTANVRYGNAGTVDLSSFLPEDVNAEVRDVVDGNDILDKTPVAYPAVDGKTLKFKLLNDVNNVDKTATINLTCTGNNYETYYIAVEVKVENKTELTLDVTAVEVTNADGNLVYNGGAVNRSGEPTTTETVKGWDYTWHKADGTKLAEAPKDAGDYYLLVSIAADDPNYMGSAKVEFTIAPKSVTITGLTAPDHPYDGTMNVDITGGTLNGVVTKDEGKVSVTMPTTGTVEDANVGNGKAVTITKPTLTGEAKDNYELTTLNEVTVDITAATPVYSVAATKTFRTGTTASAVIDAMNLPATAQGVNDEPVTGELKWYSDSDHKTPVKDADLSGIPANASKTLYWVFTPAPGETNYKSEALTGSTEFTAKDKTTLTVDVSKVKVQHTDGKLVYNGEAVSRSGEPTTTETVTGWAYTWHKADNTKLAGAPKDAGSYYLLVSIADADPDYMGSAKVKFTIAPKSVTITGLDAEDKPYDGKTDATVTGTAAIDGKVKGDTVTVKAGTASFDNKNVGTAKTVTFTGFELQGAAAGNYELKAQPASVKAKITAKPVTITGLGAEGKAYDGNATATVTGTDTAVIAGKVGEDAVTVKAGTASFDNKNVGTAKTVTFKNFALEGDDAGNYKLSAQPASVTANITAKSVTITGLAAKDKAYDGSTAATVTGTAVIAGMIKGDRVTVKAGTAAFDNKNVGTAKTVTFSGYELQGDDAGNYSLSAQPASVTAAITKATPKVDLEYTKITKADQTLADAALKIKDDAKVKGTIQWIDEKGDKLLDDTVVEKNKSYKWEFTPEDTTNYDKTTGTITLYRVSSGGGGGSFVPTTYDVVIEPTVNGTVKADPTSASEGDTVKLTVAPAKDYLLDKLVILDKDGKEIKAKAQGPVFVFEMPASKVTVKVTFKDKYQNPFTDVKDDDYFAEPVMWAVYKNITAGISDTEFGPDFPCTRAQIVTFLWNAAGKPEPASKVNPFQDVTEKDWFYKSVLWAAETGITAGISDTEFGPDLTCTRAQAMTFLWKYVGKPADKAEMPFTDVTANDWFYESVQWAVANKITSGTSESTFGSNDDCTRAQIVTFLYRALKK